MTLDIIKRIKELKTQYRAEVLETFDLDSESTSDLMCVRFFGSFFYFSFAKERNDSKCSDLYVLKYHLLDKKQNLLVKTQIPYLNGRIRRPSPFCLDSSALRLFHLIWSENQNCLQIRGIDLQTQEVFSESVENGMKQIVELRYFNDSLWAVDVFGHKIYQFSPGLELLKTHGPFDNFESPTWILSHQGSNYFGFYQELFRKKHKEFSRLIPLSDARILKFNQDGSNPIYPEINSLESVLIRQAVSGKSAIFALSKDHLLKFDSNWKRIFQLNLADFFTQTFPSSEMSQASAHFCMDSFENKILLLEGNRFKKGMILGV